MSDHAFRRLALVAGATLFVVAAMPVAAAGQTDPGWTQYQGDAAHQASVPAGPEPPYRVRWATPAPEGESLSPAAIAGPVAITLGQEALYGIDLATGDVAWEVARAGGPLATPAVTDDGDALALFVDEDLPPSDGETASPTPSSSPTNASPSGEVGEGEASSASLVAVSIADRTEAWRVALPAASRTGVTLEGETAYVGDLDGNVTAVDVTDGAIRWSVDVGGRIDAAIAATPDAVAVVSRDVDAGELAITALSPADGEQLFAPQALRLGSTAAAAPAIADGTIVTGLPDRYVHAIVAETGTERWTSLSLAVFSPVTSLAATGDAIYAVDLGGGVYALDLADGTRIWDHQLNELVLRSAPVRVGDAVLVGLQDGRLATLDATSGHLVWIGQETPGLVGALAVGPDVVVAVKGGRDAGLVAYETDPDGTLVDVESPTVLELGTTASRVAIAAAIALVVTLGPGMLARRRFGDAFAFADAEPEEIDDADGDDG